MPNTIKQAVEFICEQAARRYAPKIWLKVPFTLTNETENDGFTHVEVMLGGVKRKVIWDPYPPVSLYPTVLGILLRLHLISIQLKPRKNQ